MFRRRSVLWILIGAVGLVPAAAGHALTKPCRPLVVDPRGDLEAGAATGAPDRDDLDILALDLGGSGDRLVVTVSMAAPPSTPVPASLIDITFDVGSTTYNAYKYAGVDGTIYGFNSPAGSHVVTGTTDPQSGLVRISVPRRLIGAVAGTTIRDVGANTEELLGTNAVAVGDFRDSAGSRRTYRLGARGCL